MTDRSNRILTTHVGSLVRPPEIVAYADTLDEGREIDRDAFDASLRRCVHDVVEHQHATGIDFVSDGEYGKLRSWSFYVLARLAGIEERDIGHYKGTGRDRSLFPDFYDEYFHTQRLPKRGVVTAVGPISYQGQADIQRDIDIFKGALAGVDTVGGFMAAPAPSSAVPRHDSGFYKSDEEFLFALADALHQEYAAIINSGLTLQVDDAFLPYMYDVAFADKDLSAYRKWASLRIEALNHALRGLPEDRIRYHICWGSFNVPHVSDIPMKDIVDLVLQVNAGAYCIEMANPRHAHEWRIWEDVKLPEGRKLIPGVISHSTNVVEHPELVAERLVRMANVVGRDNVIGGTDCGFAQSPHANRVHASIMWAKLEALVEGARLASRTLWGARAA